MAPFMRITSSTAPSMSARLISITSRMRPRVSWITSSSVGTCSRVGQPGYAAAAFSVRSSASGMVCTLPVPSVVRSTV